MDTSDTPLNPPLTWNGGAVTSFACSCLLNCFAATDRHTDASLLYKPPEVFG